MVGMETRTTRSKGANGPDAHGAGISGSLSSSRLSRSHDPPSLASVQPSLICPRDGVVTQMGYLLDYSTYKVSNRTRKLKHYGPRAVSRHHASFISFATRADHVLVFDLVSQPNGDGLSL